MEINKLAVLNTLGKLPWVGRRLQLSYYQNLKLEVERIEAAFFSPTVRFTDQVHDLYDCLKGSEITLAEDFQWFHSLILNTYSKTAADAVHCLSSITNGWLLKTENYFKETEVTKRVPLLQWYSNRDYVEQFISLGLVTLQAYTTRYPRLENEKVGPAIEKAKNVFWNPSLGNFCGSQYFKMILDDFITIVLIALESHIRRLNG